MLDPSSRLTPEYAEAASDREIVQLLAELWADPEFRERLYGSREFVRERIVGYCSRGYLTPAERQGILRNLFAPAVPIGVKLSTIIQHRRTW
jgi:hypothetical protein